jgi:type IV pilus assembly protein PilP
MKLLILMLVSIVLLLTGCSGHQEDDLDRWMKDRKAKVKGRVDPLPELKKYEPFTYNADGSLSDPFKGRRAANSQSGGGLQPDLKRPKEALESFPLESLKFVGHFLQGSKNAAMVAAPDNNLYTIKVGNYIGQNFGLITKISRDELTVKEMVQDGTGGYVERLVTINPQE